MTLIEFCKKKWYYQNWLLTVDLKQAEKEFKSNTAKKSIYFAIKDKPDKKFQKMVLEKDIIW